MMWISVILLVRGIAGTLMTSLCDPLIRIISEYNRNERSILASTCKQFWKVAKSDDQDKWQELNLSGFQSLPYGPPLELAMRFPPTVDDTSKARVFYI